MSQGCLSETELVSEEAAVVCSFLQFVPLLQLIRRSLQNHLWDRGNTSVKPIISVTVNLINNQILFQGSSHVKLALLSSTMYSHQCRWFDQVLDRVVDFNRYIYLNTVRLISPRIIQWVSNRLPYPTYRSPLGTRWKC